MTPKFTGRVDKEGKLLLNPAEAAKYMRHLQKLKGEFVWHRVEKIEPTRSDPLRKYYFKWVVGEIVKHTGASLEDVHETMKLRYASEEDEFGIVHKKSVFSNTSTMKIRDKKAFILNVRNFWLDFQNVVTPEFEPKALVD